ncbi:hypothetical protein DIE23_37285 [Burkholderia sp. Bp9143]|uniref:DUF7065 domain-containing protein n=1 Tax=Burkholderia sp. Bp9143 TaxID=2184574 RepID=UPI000F59FB8C|nr:hypothetical protein [Burkholderia sp. Bp9143]RQR22052.1 hypothetical protein DIE23_37285 [Burkholderia sp. Bp9143]
MEIVGGGRIYVHPAEEDAPHRPGPEVGWQESFVLYWHDAEQAVGGCFRLGHEPNCDGGHTQFVIGITSPDGIYHRYGTLPLRPQDRLEGPAGRGFSNGDDSLQYLFDGKTIHWTLKDQDVEAHLDVELYVPAVDVHRREGAVDSKGIQGAHIDAACGVTGTMVVKGKTYKINALGIRDHGWGTRDVSSMLAHRWTVATFGKEHSFVALTFLTRNGQSGQLGWVIRNNTVIMAEKIVVRAIIGEDGGTNFGGTTRMTLTTGEEYIVKFEPMYPAIANIIHTTLYYDSLCQATWGDRVGYGCFETSNNIQGGTGSPPIYDGSIGKNGWFAPGEDSAPAS